MESYAKIDKETTIAEQIGLVHHDSNGETPNINDGAQLSPYTLKRFLLLYDVSPRRHSQTQVNYSTHRSEHDANATFQALHFKAVGRNIHSFNIGPSQPASNITHHQAFPILCRSEDIVQ